MVLIADSGSTKTDWALVGFSEVTVIQTQGINPVHQSREVILRIFRDELLPQLSDVEVRNVRFYGSGVRPDLESVVESVIRDVFPSASDVGTK